MNGTPHLAVMRSISLYGLSDVRLTFDERHRRLFRAAACFPALGDATLPSGVTPSMAPLFSPSGLVYRYVLESPDRTPQELKTLEDWVIERAYRSVPGVADDSGLRRPDDAVPGSARSGAALQLSPDRGAGAVNALTANNANAGGGFYSQGGQFYYVRGLGLLERHGRHRGSRRRSNNGVPVRVKDVGQVAIGNAPRLGIFGFQKNDE